MASGSLANGPLLAVEPGPMHMAPPMMHHGVGLMPPPVSATSTHVQQTQGSQGYPQLGAYAGYNGYRRVVASVYRCVRARASTAWWK
ncbi:hypothetical protein IscW_ISCW002584 [Ixodes scapularis]|uniref:Uncharacterized protein n=1 Tax=Ixodes scapularis TaxID=6945 RepID=B7P7R3_IXOSC|nr:hypothetical protein IscW_ISCW002584 [Ixodes scapularis]|eukprot:XP_002399464.1 hypothetical protein IscW_ISCW002584 [Ixodes scapularis]